MSLKQRLESLGQDEGEALPSEAPASEASVTTLPGTLMVQRGYVAVPTPDMQSYLQNQAFIFGTGVAVGVAAGVLVGNFFDQFWSVRRR